MKSLYKSRLFLLALASMVTTGIQAAPISKAVARAVAQQFMAINDTSSDNVPQSPYYVFSRGSNLGYVIVSGDDSTTPIIGYTDSGNFNADALPEGLKGMLDTWAERITKLQQKNPQKMVRRAPGRAAIARRLTKASFKDGWTSVPYLMRTHWNQGYPYNIFSPNRSDNGQKTLTGCVATAASQIIYYFRKDNPDTLLYNTPTYSGNGGNAPVTKSLPAGTPVRYDLMRLSGSGSKEQDTAVAVLMYAAGTSAYLMYGYQDGTATAGQTTDMGKALTSQFNLANTYCYKGNYSQQAWEQLLYNSLQKLEPIFYSGVNEKQGGHAVVVDGYDANTGLYHFNFGWGGQGDGYYTVDNTTGMNGFNEYQQMLQNIHPLKQNISARLQNASLYKMVDGRISVMVYNNSTLSAQDFKLYCSYGNSRPTSTAAEDNSTVIAPGDSALVTFSYMPPRDGVLQCYVTDGNGHQLDTLSMNVGVPQPAIKLTNFYVVAPGEVQSVDGMNFKVVNNTRVNVNATFVNDEQGTDCQPMLKADLYSYDSAAKQWSFVKSRTLSSTLYKKGQQRDTTFVFTNLTPSMLYKAVMNPTVKGAVQSQIIMAAADSVAYFTVNQSTLSVVSNGRTATVKGAWDSGLFVEQATDSAVTSYDITAVTGINEKPAAPNKNALFFASAPIQGASNVVVNGVCDSLVISADADFRTSAAFTATKATFLMGDTAIGHFAVAMVPFTFTVPQGMQARTISSISRSRMKMQNVTEVKAFTPFIYLNDNEKHNYFTAANVTVTTDTVGYDCDSLVKASTVADTTVAGASLITYNNNLATYKEAATGTRVAPFVPQLLTSYSSGIRVQDANRLTGIDVRMVALSDTLNKAYRLYDAYHNLVSHDVNNVFTDSINTAETFFHANSTTSIEQVIDQYKNLSAAMQAYLSSVATGIKGVSVHANSGNANAPVEYYSLSGERVQHPAGGVFIMKRGTMVKKVIIK